MKTLISADSTCDLPEDIVRQNNIAITPLYVQLDGKYYRDGVDITPEKVYAHVAAGGAIGSTSAVNFNDYREFFTERKKECDAIIHFTISGEMSSCYQNACLAAAEFDNVYIVDSRTLSNGIGLMMLRAIEMAARNVSNEEIIREMDRLKDKTDVSFVIDSLTYLCLGGRCSAVAALGANLLNLKPCIEVRDGKMGVVKKYRGNIGKSLEKYVSDKLKGADDIDLERLFIIDTGVTDEVYNTVLNAVRSLTDFKEIIHTHPGCTISNHCGPNALGLMFLRK